jgi:RNA polymerase sigma-70 factor (ECF subfamily)
MTTMLSRPQIGTDEDAFVAALRRGDEDAFAALVERYGALMLRLARAHVKTRASAEEVVQETWCAVVTGVERFEGRSSLKTWLMRILINRAKSRGEREHRCLPFSALAGPDDDGPVVAASVGTPDWSSRPEERLLMEETLTRMREAIAALPPRQQEVVVLRDVQGWSSDETCAALGLSEGNQRVLLHRARTGVREALEPYLDGGRSAASSTPTASHAATT